MSIPKPKCLTCGIEYVDSGMTAYTPNCNCGMVFSTTMTTSMQEHPLELFMGAETAARLKKAGFSLVKKL